jgi:surfeit locus 1 family protein
MVGMVLTVIWSATKFSPPIWATIGLVIACSLFIRAGIWQLDRGEQKRQLIATFYAGPKTELLTDPGSDGAEADSRYRRMEFTGEYDTRHQILLDNILRKGQPGYYVLTPLRTPTNLILVNRGWVPANPDRSVLPELSVGEDRRVITGRLDLLPRPGVKLTPPATTEKTPWPRRLLYPSVVEIGAQLGTQIYTYQLLLDAEHADGFARDWQPAVTGPERHLGYAVQWFGFAITLVIIYIGVNMKKTTED